jgi:predicted ATP-grasp superfamily ATP-dependent carboligase
MPADVRAGADWPPVVVCSLHQTGTNLMRDLLRRGVRVAGVDCDSSMPGFRSIYGDHHLCPNPEADAAAWTAFMKSLAQRMGGRPVLMCAADLFVTAVGRHADELAEHYRLSPSAKLQAALCTKEEQYALAEQYDFPRARTRYVQSRVELAAFAEEARFPCMLKPRSQREWLALPEGNPLRWKKVVIASTPKELLDHYALAESLRPEAVAQEMIQGPDENKYCYLAIYGSDGTRLGCSVIRELRTYPSGVGCGCVAEPVAEPEVERMCDRFFRQIGYVGPCEIEVKRDAADGRIKLIEVNPRFSGTGDSSVYAGIEVGWLHYLDLIGKKPAPVEARGAFRHIMLRLDVPGVVGALAGGALGWRELLESWRGPLAFYDFDWRDWRVTSWNLWDCAKTSAVILRRRAKARAGN